jgi:L-ascorbate 6-phosphate lactonase
MAGLLSTIEKKQVSHGIVLWWLGGSSWVLKSPTILVYVDLFTGPAPKETLSPLTKNYEDLILPEEITIADFVLSTHEHVDHCHYESLLPIYQNTKAKFVGGPSSVAKFKEWGFVEERIVLLAAYERYHRGQIEFIALPNKDCVDPGAVSYLILTQGITLFEGGDSLYFEGFKEIGHKWGVDIALLNFFKNPPDIDMVLTMTPAQVARAAQDLHAKILIPKHWNIWKELEDDPKVIGSYLSSNITLNILDLGEEFTFTK